MPKPEASTGKVYHPGEGDLSILEVPPLKPKKYLRQYREFKIELLEYT